MTDPSRSSPEPQKPNGAARHGWVTLAITNLTKLVGIALAINEAAVRENPRNSVIVLCAICVLGVQTVENVLLRMVDRLFGGNGSGR